jgi:hypothetical protein
MAITETNLPGNGTAGPFTYTFPALEAGDIYVSVDGVVKTVNIDYSLSFVDKQITFLTTPYPTVSNVIRIYRVTDDADLAATFYSGAAIRATDLNTNFTQGLYVTQESNRNATQAITTADAATATANTALSNSSAAVSTANAASASAAAAVSTANTASSNASAAVSTANTASSNAAAAVVTANTASANATTALNTANSTAAAQTALEANVYDSTELDAGQLDNRYYTETELDAGQLDNRYYTETEIDAQRWNKTTETIESGEAWVSNDTTIPTTAAINNRLIDLINDVGAYVVVNSEVTFPNTGIVDGAGSPDAGVLVAITDATGLTWNGFGISTNATTSNSTAVTITGITGTSPISNCGAQVLSTSTLHTYTFVRWVVGSSVAQTISDNINEILLVDSNAAAAAASEAAAASSASAAATSASNAASSASAASTSASNAASSASAASTSATNAATSAASAANSVTAINNLGYYLNWGLITDAVGTTSDYGALV